MSVSNFELFPTVFIPGARGSQGWKEVSFRLFSQIEARKQRKKCFVAIECYHGVSTTEISRALHVWEPLFFGRTGNIVIVHASDAMRASGELEELVFPFVTEDPVFGYISPLDLPAFFDGEKIAALRWQAERATEELVIVIGVGATLILPEPDLLIYADMPRWEIQKRFKRNEVSNLGGDNAIASFAYQYKRAFFVDWRVCDRHKTGLMDKWDYVLDTTLSGYPKMIEGRVYLEALARVVKRPFRVMPFFDPGPWGGQWLKEICNLDRSEKNFAWAFDCVPEENSLLLRLEDMVFETPSVNVVFAQPEQLLGRQVYEAFGAEFPIRFDFLDTMEGGNLSLQVHPLKAFIREQFGMAYTQDESYYFMEAKEDACVYLGLNEGIDRDSMIRDLEAAQQPGGHFDADKYAGKWPVRKHDHVLIPSGTVHCSGANGVVLEISATPYIFTFKLWDWGRMGLDGKPRPISLEHGKKVIRWERTQSWVQEHLMNKFETIAEGPGWKEERTGLDPDSFIESRRHWFTGPVIHDTQGVVNVLNLVEGREAVVESPINAFEPFVVHYAETFIVPAAVGIYSIRPHGESEGLPCATIKAFVRTDKLAASTGQSWK